MGPGLGDGIRIISILVTVGFCVLVFWLMTRQPRGRDRMPGTKVPRPVAPTQDDIEPVVEVTGSVDGREPLPALPAPREQAIELTDDPPAHNGQDRCRLCKAPVVDFNVVELEDWQQIEHSWWGRVLASRERRRALPHGREFHARRGLCRACAALGHEADREEEARLAALVASERRVWDLHGRDNAIRRRNEQAEFRYAEQLDEQRRADARMRARARDFLDDQ